MLFVPNSRPYDVENENDDFEDGLDDKADHRNGIALASVVLYFILSLIVSFFHFPISLISLAVPLVAVVHTLVVVRGQKWQFVWPCVLLNFLGALVKLASIVAFLSLFDLLGQSPSKRGVIKHHHEGVGGKEAQSKWIFFAILLTVELLVVALCSCLQWHLLAFKKCPSHDRKHNLQRY